jgi:dihydroorotate dehydrogenase electron transfer subunit
LLAGAPSAATAIPASLLPSEVEYRLATADGSRGQRGAVAELLPATIQWADQVCAAGSPSLYHALAQSIARYRLRVDDDFAQVWILGTVACGLGVCHSCTVETRHGPVLSCHDGPVFRLKEIEAW